MTPRAMSCALLVWSLAVTIRADEPQLPTPPVTRAAHLAKVFGVWTSTHDNAPIAMGVDTNGVLSIAKSRKAEQARVARGDRGLTTRVGRGDYRAIDDLIYVHWNDGTRTNLRWRLHGQMLLVTDHTGRTTRWTRQPEPATGVIEELPRPK